MLCTYNIYWNLYLNIYSFFYILLYSINLCIAYSVYYIIAITLHTFIFLFGRQTGPTTVIKTSYRFYEYK